MGILKKLAAAPFKGAYKATKWGVEQTLDPGTPLYGEKRKAYKEGKAQLRKDEAFKKGYQKGGTFHQKALSQPTSGSGQIGQIALELPKPPKPALDRVKDMVRGGKSDDEIMYILAKEGKTRGSYSVLKKAKERVRETEERVERKEKRKDERSKVHAIRKTRKTEW